VKWYAGSDHAGFRLKEALVKALRGWGDEVLDLGTRDAEDSVDYPDYGAAVGRAVAADAGALGVLVCGTGIGISIAANKVRGVRAAHLGDTFSATMSRRHNDANVACLGERVTGAGLAEEILRAFRDAAFEGGRHQRRVDKIGALDAARDA
jgi:ribose 5-phosphate isomerase B